MFVVTICHAENVSDARFVFVREATASSSALGVRRLVAGVCDDGAKQAAGRIQFCNLHFALQQRVVGCAAWFSHGKEVIG